MTLGATKTTVTVPTNNFGSETQDTQSLNSTMPSDFFLYFYSIMSQHCLSTQKSFEFKPLERLTKPGLPSETIDNSVKYATAVFARVAHCIIPNELKNLQEMEFENLRRK